MAFLFIRLTADSKHVIASYIVLGGSTVLMIISQLLIAIRCDESHPWVFVGTQCGDLVSWLPSPLSLLDSAQELTCSQFPRWQAITALDVVTELLLFGISLYMLHDLTLETTKKFIVLTAFALRLPSVNQPPHTMHLKD